jgi:hypothetical protein
MRLAALFVLGLLAGAAAAQGTVVAMTCPIDGKRFQYQSPPSAALQGRHLDMKPVAEVKLPWPLPQCPGNGFVVYKKDFKESEIARLREVVASERYRAMLGKDSGYYLAGILRREAGDPLYDVAWSLTQATWEVADDPVRYRKYAEEALAAYNALPAKLDRRQNTVREMISGELERRLGLFDAAERRFRRLRDAAEFTAPQLQHAIGLELQLIDKKDSGTYAMPR